MTKPTNHGASFARPNADSYIVPGTTLAAGAYPGARPHVSPEERDAKLNAFLDAGITAFVDLTDPADGLTPYAPRLRELAAGRDIDVVYERHTIRDMDVCEPAHMTRVLDRIDEHLDAGRRVYVHCWGGIGRTGTTVGCWLVRHGHTGDEALRQVQALFETMSPARVAAHREWGSPQTEPQREMVRGWRAGA